MVDEKWASWKIGPLYHSRWITLATRLLFLYTRKQNPSQKPTNIVKCIVQIYAPTWFPIKVSSKFADSPKILFTTISQLHSMTNDDIRQVAQKNIQGNAFCLLPENFLYAMIKDNDPAMRQKECQFIAKIRSLNARRKPRGQISKINWNAIRWQDLIDLADVNLREPPTSEHFSDSEIFSFVTGNVTTTIQDLPSHSQSVERSVKLVFEASPVVCGTDRRHKSILTKFLSRS